MKIKFSLPGLHRFPDAPKQVSFLKNIHHHTFFFTVYIELLSNNRELEFIMTKRELIESTRSLIEKLSDETKFCFSCELLGERLIVLIKNKYGEKRRYIVEITEDGIDGVIVGDVIV